jgi:putative peptidoglycan lipid II flippase
MEKKIPWKHFSLAEGRGFYIVRKYNAWGVVRSILSVAGLTAFVRVFGFVEKTVLAALFGASATMDSFTVAISIPNALLTVATAMLGPLLVPLFVRRVEEGDEPGAWGQFNAWLVAVGGVMILVSGGLLFCVEPVTRIMAPGFSAEDRARCVHLFMIFLPVIPLMAIRPVLSSMLDSRRQFLTNPVSQCARKIGFVLFLLGTARFWGVSALGWAVAASVLAETAILVAGLFRVWRKHGARPAFADPDFRSTFALMAAPTLGAVVSRVAGIVENAACSTMGQGSVTSLEFARKIVDMPLLVVTVASGSVLFTYFAEFSHRGEYDAMSDLLRAGIRVLLFIFIPITALSCALSNEVVAFVYQRGHFDAASTALVARVFFWLAFTLSLYPIEILLMRRYFSSGEYWRPTLIGAASMIFKIIWIYAMISVLGLAAVPTGIVAGLALKVVLLSLDLARRGEWKGLAGDAFQFCRLIPGAALGAAGAVWLHNLACVDVATGFVKRGCVLAAAGCFGLLLYYVVSYTLGSRECRFVLERVRRRTT